MSQSTPETVERPASPPSAPLIGSARTPVCFTCIRWTWTEGGTGICQYGYAPYSSMSKTPQPVGVGSPLIWNYSLGTCFAQTQICKAREVRFPLYPIALASIPSATKADKITLANNGCEDGSFAQNIKPVSDTSKIGRGLKVTVQPAEVSASCNCVAKATPSAFCENTTNSIGPLGTFKRASTSACFVFWLIVLAFVLVSSADALVSALLATVRASANSVSFAVDSRCRKIETRWLRKTVDKTKKAAMNANTATYFSTVFSRSAPNSLWAMIAAVTATPNSTRAPETSNQNVIDSR